MENKYQEALDKIRGYDIGEVSSVTYIGHIERKITGFEEADVSKEFDLLQELIDKATPKHIILVWTKIYEMFYGVCPTCGEWKYVNIMNEETSGYCERCGQRLDWSKESEENA